MQNQSVSHGVSRPSLMSWFENPLDHIWISQNATAPGFVVGRRASAMSMFLRGVLLKVLVLLSLGSSAAWAECEQHDKQTWNWQDTKSETMIAQSGSEPGDLLLAGSSDDDDSMDDEEDDSQT
jgi:hypothetical protein